MIEENGAMKTTLDIPAALVKQVKRQATLDGQNLQEAIADLLRKGLATTATPKITKAAVVRKDKKTGLPVIVCKHAAAPGKEVSPDQVAAILLAQEAGWHHATGG